MYLEAGVSGRLSLQWDVVHVPFTMVRPLRASSELGSRTRAVTIWPVVVYVSSLRGRYEEDVLAALQGFFNDKFARAAATA